MKYSSLRITLVLLLITHICIAQQALKLQPEKPKPGQKISFVYDPAGTELFGMDSPEAYAYLLEGDRPLVREIRLKKRGKVYTGEFITHDTTRAVFLSFSKDEKRDNNGDKGYYSLLYDEAGTPLVRSRMSAATAFASYGGIWGMKRNADVAIMLNKEELKANPHILAEKPLLVAQGLYSSKEEADNTTINRALTTLVANNSSTEMEITAAKNIYLTKLKNKARADEIDSVIKARFPNGNWIRMATMNRIFSEKDPDKQAEIFAGFPKELNDGSPQTSGTLNSLASTIALNYANAGKLEKISEYASLITDKGVLANLYNSIAWKQSGESIDGKPGDLPLATELSAKSLELVNEIMKEPKNKPLYMTDAQYRKSLERTYSMYADTYALLLYHAKEYQKAYDIQKKVVESMKRLDVSTNEAFAAYAEKTHGPEVAIRELESFVQEGRYTPKMKAQLKKLYLTNNSEDSWMAYVAKLEAANLEKQRAGLVKKMINESAPSFTLKDMQGNEVTLASLKGKVVVVDFWATWCGPCIASFPGMKQAVEKYKEDKNVRFVFIDTWENGEKDIVKKNVAEFIEKNAYPFDVLMDMDSKVVEAFKVEGIPTKFVIDTNNKIRFRSVGFSGSADGLVTELTMMIDMAKGAPTSGTKKKAF